MMAPWLHRAVCPSRVGPSWPGTMHGPVSLMGPQPGGPCDDDRGTTTRGEVVFMTNASHTSILSTAGSPGNRSAAMISVDAPASPRIVEYQSQMCTMPAYLEKDMCKVCVCVCVCVWLS